MCIGRLQPGDAVVIGGTVVVTLIAAADGLATFEAVRRPLPGDGPSRIQITVERGHRPLLPPSRPLSQCEAATWYGEPRENPPPARPPIAGPEAVGD